jgi:catechol 2,3-dioxygenase-like lactoylglutathione lyase family enzyme
MMTTTDTTASSPQSSARQALTGIHHVGLTVTDVEASAAWYQQMLGLQREFDEPHHRSDQGGRAIVLCTADMSMSVGLDHHPANRGEGFDATRTGLDHVCFQVVSVDELQAWATHLDTEGVPNSGVYAMAAMPISLVTFHDPDGIQLELIAFHA